MARKSNTSVKKFTIYYSASPARSSITSLTTVTSSSSSPSGK